MPSHQCRRGDQERQPALPRQQPGQRGQDQAIRWYVARADKLAVKHRQLVAQDGDLDVLVVWFGTEADQPEDVSYNEEHDRAGHASHPGRCPSWLLRAAILYLHPSGYGPLCHSFNYQPKLPRSPR